MQKIDHNKFPHSGSLKDQTLFALGYAVRAPSTHNSQPWLFNIDNDKVSIYADLSRQLPEGDKDMRDMYISLGACLHHTLAAFDYFQMLETTKIGNLTNPKDPIAVVSVHTSLGTKNELLPSILAIENRFNARGPFLKTIVSDEILQFVKNFTLEGGVTLDLLIGNKSKYAELTGEGMREAHSIRSFRREISHWMISNYSSRKDGIPGHTMLAPGMLSIVLPKIIGTFNMGKLLAKLNAKSINSSAGIVVLSSTEDTPPFWLKVGIEFQRISLYLNSHGIFTSVYVASIEIPKIRTRLKADLNIVNYPQFTFAFGFPKFNLRQSPRFSPSERMIQL